MGHKTALPHPTPIPDEAMEVIADVLIACAEVDSDIPAYNEEQLDRRRRRAIYAEEYFGILANARNSCQQSQAEAHSIRDCLTVDDRVVWDMHTAGYRISEMARRLNISRSAVIKRLRNIRRHIHMNRSAFHGLEEVYHHEVHKRTYRHPQHCNRQPCKRLGYCKFPSWRAGIGRE